MSRRFEALREKLARRRRARLKLATPQAKAPAPAPAVAAIHHCVIALEDVPPWALPMRPTNARDRAFGKMIRGEAMTEEFAEDELRELLAAYLRRYRR
jgi:hypothetical protein